MHIKALFSFCKTVTQTSMKLISQIEFFVSAYQCHDKNFKSFKDENLYENKKIAYYS